MTLSFAPLISEVSAHCDVPCGVYETDTLRNAAFTCRVMVQKITELGELDSPEKMNSFVRMVATKEAHAERAKHELAVLWGDYFKPEHLEKFPDLHTTFWGALKQASKVKQTISLEEAERLIEQVGGIVTMFADSKKQ